MDSVKGVIAHGYYCNCKYNIKVCNNVVFYTRYCNFISVCDKLYYFYYNNNFIWSIKTWKYIMHSEGPQLKHHIHSTIKQINGCP